VKWSESDIVLWIDSEISQIWNEDYMSVSGVVSENTQLQSMSCGSEMCGW
jgi:hypothetical protein